MYNINIYKKGLSIMNLKLILSTNLFFLLLSTIIVSLNSYSQESVIEDIIVTAEKRDESLQTVSQAVTALTDSELEAKNITSFVDLTAIVPGELLQRMKAIKLLYLLEVLEMKQTKTQLLLRQLHTIWMAYL